MGIINIMNNENVPESMFSKSRYQDFYEILHIQTYESIEFYLGQILEEFNEKKWEC